MNFGYNKVVYNSVMGKLVSKSESRNGPDVFFGKAAASYKPDSIAGGYGQLADILRDSGWASEGKKSQDDDPERLKMILEDSYKLQRTWCPGWPECVYLNKEVGENVITLTTLLLEMIKRNHLREEVVMKWVRRKSEFEYELKKYNNATGKQRMGQWEGSGDDFASMLDEEDRIALEKARGEVDGGIIERRTIVHREEPPEVVVLNEKGTEAGRREEDPKMAGDVKRAKVKEIESDANRKLNMAIRDKMCKRFCGSRKRALDYMEDKQDEYVVIRKEDFQEMEMEMQRLRQQLKDRDRDLAEIEEALDRT